MVQAHEIRKGMVIIQNNQPYLVLSHDIHKYGRGGSNNKTKLKNLINGAIVPVTFSGNEKAEEADVMKKNVQYLYEADNNAFFMDPESFEQYQLLIETIPGERDFLKEGEKYQGLFFNGEIISVELPKKMTLKVIEAADAVRGDSSNNPQKEVTLETGAKVRVPLFIKQGESIQVNTETWEYSGKA